MRPNGGAGGCGGTTENQVFWDFSKVVGGTVLVSRAQFKYVLRKFQPDFGGPGTPGHPPAGPNRLQIWTPKPLERRKIVKNRCFSGGPGLGGPAGTVGRGVGGPGRPRWADLGLIFEAWGGWLGGGKIVKNRCFSGFSRECAHRIGPNLLGGGPRARRACGGGRLGRGWACWAAPGRFGAVLRGLGRLAGAVENHRKNMKN